MARAVISICILVIIILVAVSVWSFMPPTAAPAPTTRITPKILTVAMEQDGDPQTTNTGEASAWVQNDQLNQKIEIVGGNGPAYCNAAYDHCLIITGVGVINASITIMALGLSDKFDLGKTYIMVAGIAGTPPDMATIGSAAWSEYVVYGGLAIGIDPREPSFDWRYLLGRLGCATPWCDQGYVVGTEVYHLNPTLRDWAFNLSERVPLADSPEAEVARALYSQENARRKPFITKCDGMMTDTFWAGKLMSSWATWWVAQQTGGAGIYCMAAFEDSGTLAALARLATSGRIGMQRVMVLRAASDFDQPHSGETALESLQVSLNNSTGASTLAFENLYRAGSVVNAYILQHWTEWEKGVPPLPKQHHFRHDR
jgi:purine nucleoside permease